MLWVFTLFWLLILIGSAEVVGGGFFGRLVAVDRRVVLVEPIRARSETISASSRLLSSKAGDSCDKTQVI